MLLSRQEFVAICSQAIIKTRKNIDIENQLSGYNKFHREIKETLTLKQMFAMSFINWTRTNIY
ncbi:hypothetical protein [Legionella spiritensis]|uniref:Uncharacterized protein n=1 Tax=Legionella spiritensis TaxID=452 RepID=A0A0W0Z5C8_LEGSP|nr:hypothetical protein [Legionella spiritensis]KTD64317.1 hypothetical protein Lspi_1124 [Legionella spiritensis]SNV46639.1 Uncharacterised protein [Legionella spiritensis]